MAIRWDARLIASEAFETATAFDVDGDGVLDIVSGSFWYKGPDFKERHNIGNVPRHGEYYDDFSAVPIDLDGDGQTWLVTGGWWGKELRCRRVSSDGPWPERLVARTGSIESTRGWDVDGDGELEVVPNTPYGPLVVYKRVADRNGETAGELEAHEIWHGRQGHGLGFGDVSGSGRGDFVMNHGWLEAPEDRWGGEWKYHPEFQLPKDASVPIVVADINGDGISELIVGHGHSYGLEWWGQRKVDDGSREWSRHSIDETASQFHDLLWDDIDGDGAAELVTGKRWRAHPNGTDAGGYDDIGIYYFKWRGNGFEKNVIRYGPLGVGVGTGISFALADLRNTGRLDIVAAGKDGLHVLYNQGVE